MWRDISRLKSSSYSTRIHRSFMNEMIKILSVYLMPIIAISLET